MLNHARYYINNMYQSLSVTYDTRRPVEEVEISLFTYQEGIGGISQYELL